MSRSPSYKTVWTLSDRDGRSPIACIWNLFRLFFRTVFFETVTRLAGRTPPKIKPLEVEPETFDNLLDLELKRDGTHYVHPVVHTRLTGRGRELEGLEKVEVSGYFIPVAAQPIRLSLQPLEPASRGGSTIAFDRLMGMRGEFEVVVRLTQENVQRSVTLRRTFIPGVQDREL